MSEKTAELGFLDHLAASAWSILPEETAASLAGIKKDFLTSLRSTIDSMVDHEINEMNRHLENARNLRNHGCEPKPDGQQAV